MLICGTGKNMDKCRDLVKELGCTDRIIFAGYRYDAKELLHGADAFIFPSYREGLGLALSRLWEQVFRSSFRITEERENMR